MTTTNPDQQRHVFDTFLGLPPDADDAPVCGQTLTSAYDGRNRPDCPACAAILATWKARQVTRAIARHTDALRASLENGR